MGSLLDSNSFLFVLLKFNRMPYSFSLDLSISSIYAAFDDQFIGARAYGMGGRISRRHE